MAAADVALVLAILMTAALGGLALARAPRGRLRWSFGLGMFGFALEAACGLVLVRFTDTAAERLRWLDVGQTATLLLLVPWSVFAVALGTPWTRAIGRPWRRRLDVVAAAVIAAAAASLMLGGFEVSDIPGAFYAARVAAAGRLAIVLQLVLTVGVLATLEAALRGSRGEARWRTKYLVLGLGGIFLVRFYFLSQTLLFNVLFASYIRTSAATLLLGGAVVGVSLGRDRLNAELTVSRHVVYRSLAVGVLGAYLLALAGIAWLLNRFGIPEEVAWTSVVIFVSALGLAAVMLSEAVRWRIKRFVTTNFYRDKYDYRVQWMSFTRRLGSLLALEQLAPELLATLAETTGARALVLYVRDDTDGPYHAVSALGTPRPPGAVAAAAPLVAGFQGGMAPRSLSASEAAESLDLAVAHALGEGAVAVPLPWRGGLLGVLLVGGERTGAPYGGEDMDFLATVGQQAAGAIATAQLSESLASAREFEAFHRLTSFVIHDLKNSVSALSMLSDNASRHFDDPEFQRDAVKTLGLTVEKMTRLMDRMALTSDASRLRRQPVDLAALVLEATKPLAGSRLIGVHKKVTRVRPVSGDPEALLRVVQNLVTNAAQSIDGPGSVTLETYEEGERAFLVVSDTGCGMSEEFLRKSLFSPFRTTKKGGWGIGLYQTKGIVESHGGAIEVSSTEGHGTTFRVSLPLGPGDKK